ncbi:MAG: penicillin-binding protein 1C [Gammaproteobacteria bacterium]|nr:MAG: penicillin-binding protein 1C [Gammaproteobacteria bacterium]
MRRFFWGLGSLCILITLVYIFSPKPDLITFTSYSKAFVDRNDKLLRITLAEDQRYRLYTPLSSVADNLKQATVLYEDKDYYQHIGIDATAILRAFWATYITQQRRIGASTITMQVARLRWQIPSNTITGKIEQLIRALQLARHYSKQEVLEAYLNLAPYGRNIEGIGAASLIYFNKQPADLSLPEALTLAVIPQNPNKRTPTTVSGFKHASSARINLFNKWLELYPNAISQQKYMSLPLQVRAPEQLPFLAPHFITYLDNQLSRWEHGIIKTSLNSDKQKQLEHILSSYIASKSNIGIANASALLLNYKTMQIESMVGSADFHNTAISGQVNGVLAKRSPGSTLKPFVYGLAIDEGLIHPMTLLKDAPKRFGGFSPENYDKQFLGPILAGNALIESRNVPAVDLQAKLTKTSFYAFLKSAGITKLKQQSFYGLALALGGGEVSMLELVKLYALLANQGALKSPSGFFNNTILASEDEKKLLSPEASYLILNILKDNPPPTEFGLHVFDPEKNDVAWKTGTSWAFRDAWSIGISGDYIIAVWVGNFDGSGNDAFVGRTAAGPLLFSALNALIPQQAWSVEKDTFTENLNVKKVEMCKNTGDLPGKHCLNKQKSWFIPGVSPIKISTIYRAIPILKSTGERACEFDLSTTEMKVYEFWPSDFLHIFQQAGISLKTPPAYAANCSLDQTSSSGQSPVIRSPQSNLEYVLQHDNPLSNQIPFTATVDPDAKTLYWFINDRFIAKSNADKPFFWQAEVGEFTIRAVDDSGRASSGRFKVVNIIR